MSISITRALVKNAYSWALLAEILALRNLSLIEVPSWLWGLDAKCKLLWFGAEGEQGAVETSDLMSQHCHGFALPDSQALVGAQAILYVLKN